MQEQITTYIRAGFAGLYLVTAEEVRAEAEIRAVAEQLGYQLFAWTITGGLINVATGSGQEMPDPVEAAACVAELPEKSILMLKDFHQFLGDSAQPASPLVTRTLRDQIREARTAAKVVLVTGCTLQLPPELTKEFTVVSFDLPGADALREIAASIAASASIEVGESAMRDAAEAARGLTVTEAEDIMAFAVVSTGSLDPKTIAIEKARAVGRDGILEIIDPQVTAASIGGLDALKTWLGKRRLAFSPEARAFGLPGPKGVLILGLPGTGKSLTAKAASSILGRPILRLDAGKLFAGIVGESEANLRRAVQTAEAIAPCILWIDEIEKGMSGSRSSAATDGGTSARVFGSFISWMQEKTSPVFVVATANDISQLPPELLRKGRFDELFFVDLPDAAERAAIWRIHIAARGRDPDGLDVNAFTKRSEGFTGSEIEQAVTDALFDCFDAGTELNNAALTGAIDRTVPLSVTMAEDIRALRKWAAGRARSASSNTSPTTSNGCRRIEAGAVTQGDLNV